jgi:hypothetical protein
MSGNLVGSDYRGSIRACRAAGEANPNGCNAEGTGTPAPDDCREQFPRWHRSGDRS